MPEGGCLTIETANTYLDEAYVRRFGDVEPGQYVVLCVTDTGTGIATEILDRVFEPFFTTKGAGEGSGLGLAMVHGFVKQSGGHMRIYSEEGQRHDGEDLSAASRQRRGDQRRAGRQAGRRRAGARARGPTRPMLSSRTMTACATTPRRCFEELGYSVLEAGDAKQALRAHGTSGRRIDLLFTDVVLPGGVNGRELADQARERIPRLPVLYTTGYTRNAIVHQGRLDPDVHLLNKPYTQQDLARKVRELLDAARRADAEAAFALRLRPPLR